MASPHPWLLTLKSSATLPASVEIGNDLFGLIGGYHVLDIAGLASQPATLIDDTAQSMSEAATYLIQILAGSASCLAPQPAAP